MAILSPCAKAVAVVSVLCQFAVNGWAQNYPVKVVRYLVNESAGSGSDLVGRVVAEGLAEAFGQQVIVDNRPGAAGNIGAEIAARAPADGYTLLQMSSALTANISLYRNLPYDLVRDFSAVTQLVLSPHIVVVHPSLPVKSIGELIKLAKARPGAINYAAAGIGSATFVAGEVFKAQASVNLLQVPYKGGGDALISIVAGETSVYFAPFAAALPYIRQGRLRALAVTPAKRVPLLPELPTVAEAGVPGYESSNWFGLLVPVKTPKETIAAVHRAAVTVLGKPTWSKRLSDMGFVPVGNQPEEFGAHITSQIAMLAKLFQQTGVTAH